MISRRAACLALVAALSFPPAARAQSMRGRYFVVVWGFENGADPTEAHTFAAFYRGDDLEEGRVQPATISWLPASGIVHAFGTERGKNFSLGETFAIAKRRGARLASFGPYEVSAETHARALARIRLLRSGKVAYTMINGPDGAMNCIEAAGSVGGSISTGMSYGHSVSETVANHLAIRSGEVDRDAASRLRLKKLANAGRSAASS